LHRPAKKKYLRKLAPRRRRRQGDDLIIVCSWCGKIRSKQNRWIEADVTLNIFSLRGAENSELPTATAPPPLLSHGMCELCFQKMSAAPSK
jgi:hypothetical protein